MSLSFKLIHCLFLYWPGVGECCRGVLLPRSRNALSAEPHFHSQISLKKKKNPIASFIICQIPASGLLQLWHRSLQRLKACSCVGTQLRALSCSIAGAVYGGEHKACPCFCNSQSCTGLFLLKNQAGICSLLGQHVVKHSQNEH